MPRIKRIVRNMPEESEKVKYDPETGTNWCHLPMEMRMMCIERMNFETRTRISCTSKTEQSLVASRKYPLDRVSLQLSDEVGVFAQNAQRWRTKSEIKKYAESSRNEKNLACVLSILKTCKIKSFNLLDFGEEEEDEENPRSSEEEIEFQTKKKAILDEITSCVPFSFKRITIHSQDLGVIRMFLRNCHYLERITFRSEVHPDFALQEITSIPSVINVQQLYFALCNVIDPLWDLVGKWIEMDAPLGKTVQFQARFVETVATFAAKFQDRIIERGRKWLRIRMDDSRKQILLRNTGFNRWHDVFEFEEAYIMCKVVPIDLAASQYSIGVRYEGEEDWDEEDVETGDEWIDNLQEINDPNGRYAYRMDSDESICTRDDTDSDATLSDE